MKIFNYFADLKKEFNLSDNIFSSYNLVNIGGKFIYIEGHKGLVNINDCEISCKLSKGLLCVRGENLKLKVLNKTTIGISGKIYNTEVN